MPNPKYEAFLKVAELGSIKAAAQGLGYTQAGLSYLIKTLEEELGLPLFVREYGGVRLSSEGVDLLPRIQEIANDERRLLEHVNELKNLKRGTVRVASFTSTSIAWIPQIARTFSQTHPGISLELIVNDDQRAVEQLIRTGEVDCGFAVRPIADDLTSYPLVHDPLRILLPTSHPLAHRAVFPSEALAEEPYIELENGEYSEMDELFRKNGVTPQVRFVISNDYAVMSMVEAGLGFGVLPELILRNTPFDMAILKPEIPTEREIHLVIREEKTASEATRAFVACVEDWISKTYNKSRISRSMSLGATVGA